MVDKKEVKQSEYTWHDGMWLRGVMVGLLLYMFFYGNYHYINMSDASGWDVLFVMSGVILLIYLWFLFVSCPMYKIIGKKYKVITSTTETKEQLEEVKE